MDKETLSNYGWIVICVLVLAVMLALATPFGKFISNAIENTTTALFQTSKAGLGSAGIDAGELVFGKQDGGAENPDTPDASASKIIPSGAKYTVKADGTTLVGDGVSVEFPEIPATNDTYEYGDYIYTYNKGGNYGTEWSVKVKDTSKTSYGEILSEIAGKPMTCMVTTFRNCTSITTAPTIPEGITSLDTAFYGCSNLKDVPAIPSSVTNLNYTFGNCTSLETAPIIPSNVTNMDGTFRRCTSLTTAPTIPSSVTNMWSTFQGCTSLTTAPAIPSSVTIMAYTFQGCTSLTAAPVIPNSVTNMNGTFNGCTALTGTIEINANPSYYNECLKDTQITGITGSCSQETKDALLATK